MSYDPRLAARPYGVPDDDDDEGGRKGSVRAARERMQSAANPGPAPNRPRMMGLPQRPNQHITPNSSRQAPQQQQQDLVVPENTTGGALSPQWPLPSNNLSPYRGPPPQRPPRPVSDDLPIQQLSPGYRESFQSDDLLSPISNPSRPLTTSSAASEASSLGSIPDFPVPQMPVVQQQSRRTPSLGPPPSSRRGPPTFYTQMSYVSPIAEEVETRSNTIRSHHGSFASSNVMPYNDDYYVEDAGFRSEDDETITSEYGRESRASSHDDSSGLMTPALLRQASLGRRTKPSLMTIKSVDSGVPVKRKPSADSEEMPEIPAAVLAARGGYPGGGSVLFDPSSEENSFNTLRDPEKEAFAQAAAAGRGAKPRPPRLDIDAVRDAEARGSLTSLPELIRRATRLAANLDRGKTASRLSLAFWEAGAPPKKGHKSGSMTDMLAAFPPPGAVTPNGVLTPRPKGLSKWPTDGARSLGSESAMSNRKDRRRRCCGMPMWTFVTLLIVLFFLIAAAVVIPIALIVIPRMREAAPPAAQDMSGMNGNGNNGNPGNPNIGNGGNTNPSPPPPTSSSGTQNSQCSGIITCQNGGVAVLNGDRTCNCVCINGFTGSTCATARAAGCTTMSVPGTDVNDATVGTGIPRLVESAESFQIPINATRLTSLFSSLSMSCTAENALITFNGLATRSLPQGSIPIMVGDAGTPTQSLPKLEAPHRNHALRVLSERQTIGQPGTANAPASSRPNSANTNEASDIVQPISSNSTALDFARVSVLVALLETGKLDTAANAQESIQDFLTSNRNGNSNSNTVNVGPLTVDLVQLSIKFQNGTTIQARVNPS
ncbi:unnamed protein product [Periconia digitata]|uniref:EGF-like domain-containing protein n=1 Tax=Periconia digitata TaxID=1303443 RepID=A0A9W4XN68_9PLEO|nr:unnamed protein product [Periconia digitata]